MRVAWMIGVLGAACGATGTRVVEHPALERGTVDDLVCDESGTAYAHVTRVGGELQHELLHVEPTGHVNPIDLGGRATLAQGRGGGAWALTDKRLIHVSWGRIDRSIAFDGGGRVVPITEDAVVVLRAGREGTAAFVVSERGTHAIGMFEQTYFTSPIADGRGGLWAIVDNYPGGKRYAGTTPFVHWNGASWRLWNATDGEGAVLPGPIGTLPVGVSPVWTGSVLMPEPNGGFTTPGSRQFIGTGLSWAKLMRIGPGGELAAESSFIAAPPDAVFGLDVRDGSTIMLAWATPAEIRLARIPHVGAAREQSLRAPAGWRPSIASSYRVCAAGATTWVAVAHAIVGETGDGTRVELVARD